MQSINNVKQLDQAFTTLIEQREKWEAGTYASSNTELYALLSHCLNVMYKVKRFTELARGLNGLLEKRGFKFTAGTSVEVKLLRAVFGDPNEPNKYRNRIYGYARVLSVAYAKEITSQELPNFITEQGGIEEIRRSDPNAAQKSEDAKVLRAQAEITLMEPTFTAIATGIKVTAELEPASDQHFSIALIRKEADGTGSIVFGSNNVALVNSLLGIAGREIDANEEEERKRKKAKELQDKRQAEIEALGDQLYPGTSSSTAVSSPTPETA